MAPNATAVVILFALLWIHSVQPQDNKDVTTTPGPPGSGSTSSSSTAGAEQAGGRARAINFTTMGDDSGNASVADVDGNGHPEATTLRAKASKAALVSGERRLDDVSMDDDDNMEGMSLHPMAANASSSSPRPALSSSTSSSAMPTTQSTSTPPSTPTIVDGAVVPSTVLPTCVDTDGKVYVEGQRFSKACDQMCSCAGGSVSCSPRCKAPFMRRGARADPLCVEKDSDDPCCVLMVCASESEPEPPAESCTFKNKTYSRGQTFFDACESTCNCGEAGNVTCKPRCPPTEAKMSDRCVAVPDSADPCCTVVLCDVTLGDEVAKPAMGAEEAALSLRLQLGGAGAVNSTAVRLSFPGGDLPDNVTVEASVDGRVWSRQEVVHEAGAAVISALQSGRTYFIRLRVPMSADMGNTVEVSLPAGPPTSAAPPSTTAAPAAANGTSAATPSAAACTYKGKGYALDEEFHDGCLAFCACTSTGMQCAPLECPTDFGLDLLDPECLDWETVPRNFVPQPPHCCPEKVSCRNNGSCAYEGQRFPNFSEIPTKVTGCGQRCYCEYGNVTCEAVCPPVAPAPPAALPCEPQQAILGHQHGDDCCLFWMCPQPVPHFGGHPGNETDQGERPPAPPTPSKASFPLVLAPTPAPGPVGVLAPSPSPSPPPTSNAPFPGPFAPPKAPQSAFPGPFAPTPSPPAKGKPHKTHYIGPFRIDDDDNENSTPHKVPEVEQQQPPKPVKRPASGAPPPPGIHIPVPVGPGPQGPGPQGVRGEPSDHDYEDNGEEEQHFHQQQIHGHAGPYFPLSPDKKNPEYQIIAVVPHNVPQGIPSHQGVPPYHQGVPPYQDLPPRGGVPPQGLPPHRGTPSGQRHPTQEDLLYLQHVHGQDGVQVIQQGAPQGVSHGGPQGVPQAGTDVYLLHNQQGLHGLQGDKVYHVDVPQGPQGQHPGVPQGVPPGLHEQIIAHLREAGALRPNKQQQQQPPAHPLPLPFPPQHGQGLGHEHEDDLATETSRHPAQLQQQLAQLLGNHSYSPGFPEGPLPPGFPQHPGIGRQDEVTVQTLEAVDESTVRLVFSVPPVLVGLHGRVELRYTSDVQNDEPATWEQQVLAPPNDLIATPQLEFELGGLQAETVYKIKITVILRDLHNTPSSKVLKVRTLPRSAPATTQPPQIPVDAELTVAEVNASWARLTWRKATPFEINFIDGVQLRYKEIDGKVYAATPLIHRAVTSYTLEGLRPDTQYEVGIYFIPFTGQTTELLSERTVTFTTGIENDPYKFELTLDVHHIKSTSVELSWQGVPYPEDKFVNIFRAIYQSDAGKEDFSSFKIAKRDSPPKTMIQDLKPGTRYRLWLEAYLTNGRIKKSNVQDFITKPGSAPTAAGSTQQGKLEGTPLAEVSDYYGPLVAVAIIATLAILTSLILTLLLMKKCAQSKAAISTCRKSQSAYDNPSYKTSENESITSNGRSRNARDSADDA